MRPSRGQTDSEASFAQAPLKLRLGAGPRAWNGDHEVRRGGLAYAAAAHGGWRARRMCTDSHQPTASNRTAPTRHRWTTTPSSACWPSIGRPRSIRRPTSSRSASARRAGRTQPTAAAQRRMRIRICAQCAGATCCSSHALGAGTGAQCRQAACRRHWRHAALSACSHAAAQARAAHHRHHSRRLAAQLARTEDAAKRALVQADRGARGGVAARLLHAERRVEALEAENAELAIKLARWGAVAGAGPAATSGSCFVQARAARKQHEGGPARTHACTCQHMRAGPH